MVVRLKPRLASLKWTDAFEDLALFNVSWNGARRVCHSKNEEIRIMGDLNAVRRILEPREKILWAARGAAAPLFRLRDWMMLPFGLTLLFIALVTMALAYFIAWDMGATATQSTVAGAGLWALAVFSLSCLVSGLALIAGPASRRLAGRLVMPSRTDYVVTDRRALVFTSRGFTGLGLAGGVLGARQTLHTMPLERGVKVHAGVRSDGSGWVALGQPKDVAGVSSRLSAEGKRNRSEVYTQRRAAPIVFQGLHDVRTVADLIQARINHNLTARKTADAGKPAATTTANPTAHIPAFPSFPPAASLPGASLPVPSVAAPSLPAPSMQGAKADTADQAATKNKDLPPEGLWLLG